MSETDDARIGNWPVRQDEQRTDTVDKWVQSACTMCSIGCGLDIGVKNGKIVGVRGRTEDRCNKGRLGPKGMNCHREVYHSKDRLVRASRETCDLSLMSIRTDLPASAQERQARTR